MIYSHYTCSRMFRLIFNLASILAALQSAVLLRVGKAFKVGIVCQAVAYLDQVYHGLQVRERDWANVVTAHADDSAAYTWRLQNFCLGEHVLRPPSDAKKGALAALPTPVTCVAVSSCGNFGLVGSQSGRLDRYNLQSGLHRGSYQRQGVYQGILRVVKILVSMSCQCLSSLLSNWVHCLETSLLSFLFLWLDLAQPLPCSVSLT